MKLSVALLGLSFVPSTWATEITADFENLPLGEVAPFQVGPLVFKRAEDDACPGDASLIVGDLNGNKYISNDGYSGFCAQFVIESSCGSICAFRVKEFETANVAPSSARSPAFSRGIKAADGGVCAGEVELGGNGLDTFYTSPGYGCMNDFVTSLTLTLGAGNSFITAEAVDNFVFELEDGCDIQACLGDGPGMTGDPHIKTWLGKYFDYMGECDLVLTHAPNFDGEGNDLSIHVRTKIRQQMSYIEAAALKIGDDVLEVASFGDWALNGVETPEMDEQVQVGGYPVYHTPQWNIKKHVFDVVLGPSENITISTYKDLVNVQFKGTSGREMFSQSSGIIGSIDGVLLARNGTTEMSANVNDFGQEWQVTDDEPMLFRTARHPQFPSKCILPSPEKSGQRRLGETIAKKAAEKVCSGYSGVSFDNCVHDVMAFGDLELAEGGAF